MSRWINSYDEDAPVPAEGSEWIWEKRSWSWDEIPVLASRREINIRVTVEETKWNGEEWWVKVSGYWNDLGRFWEAVSPIPRSRSGT